MWGTISGDIYTFVCSYFQDLLTIGNENVLQPFGLAVQSTAENDLMQFYYIDIPAANAGEQYGLMRHVDHWNYCMFLSCPEILAKPTIRALFDRSTAFGMLFQLASDGPPRFRIETARRIAKGFSVPRHFRVLYFSRGSGGVERFGKALLRVFGGVVSELRLYHGEWLELLTLM